MIKSQDLLIFKLMHFVTQIIKSFTEVTQDLFLKITNKNSKKDLLDSQKIICFILFPNSKHETGGAEKMIIMN